MITYTCLMLYSETYHKGPVTPILRDHWLKRSPVLKDHQVWGIHCKWTCHQRPPVVETIFLWPMGWSFKSGSTVLLSLKTITLHFTSFNHGWLNGWLGYQKLSLCTGWHVTCPDCHPVSVPMIMAPVPPAACICLALSTNIHSPRTTTTNFPFTVAGSLGPVHIVRGSPMTTRPLTWKRTS